jgi:hypothetical protein
MSRIGEFERVNPWRDMGWTRTVESGFIHVIEDGDISPQFMGYEPECGMCWLGYGHSERFHAHRAQVRASKVGA